MTEVLEKGDAEFLAGLHQIEENIARVTTSLEPGTVGDLALGDVAANVILGAVGVQREFGPVEMLHLKSMYLEQIDVIEKMISDLKIDSQRGDSFPAPERIRSTPDE